MQGIIYVAMGGALGASARYMISLLPSKTVFPIWTLLTNVIGAFLIGFIVGILSNGTQNERATLFWKTGVCGGFTTFSTFSLEALGLWEQGRIGMGSMYILFSVGLCMIGVATGKIVAGYFIS